MYRKTKEKSGFTLVELIVVLTILAILAGLLIPALTGYIDKAKRKTVIEEVRMIQTAVQTQSVEFYAHHEFNKNITSIVTIASKSGEKVLPEQDKILSAEEEKQNYQSIVSLSEVPSLQDETGHFLTILDKQGKVYLIVYNDGKGFIGAFFKETGEYLVYKTPSEANDAGLAGYMDKICYMSSAGEEGQEGAMWTKEFVLVYLGVTQ